MTPTPEALREWRDRMRLSQAEAATRLGISQRAWQMWEAGERTPPPYLFRALRDVERELAEER